MPDLPDPTQISRRIPRSTRGIVDIESGQIGRAVEGAGGTVLQMGMEQAGIEDKYDIALAKTKWLKARSDAESGFEDDRDYSTMEERFRGKLGEVVDGASSHIRNKSIRAQFELQQQSDIEIDSERMRGRARGIEKDHNRAVLMEDLASMREIALKGDPLTTEEAISNMQTRISSAVDMGILSESEGVNQRQKTTSDYAITRVELAPVAERANMLKKLGKYIKTDDQDKILRGIQQENAKGRAEYTKKLNDYIQYVSAGNEDTGDYSSEEIRSVYGDKAPGMIEAVRDAREFGKAYKQVQTATPEELDNLIENNKPKTPEKFGRESRQYQALLKARNERNKQLSSDPGGFVAATNPEAGVAVKGWLEAVESGQDADIKAASENLSITMRAEQERLGISPTSVAILPKQVEDRIAVSINDFSQGGEQAALRINQMKTAFGDDWGQVQKQLQSNKKMASGVRVISDMEPGLGQNLLAEAYSVGEKTYKDVLGDNYKDIQDDSLSEMEDFSRTLRGQPGGEAAVSQYKQSIELLAMKLMADGSEGSSSEALNKAYEYVIGDRFEFFDTYRIPKAMAVDQVDRGIEVYTSDLKQGDIDLFVPPSLTVENKEDAKAVYLMKLQPTAITEPDGNGVLFVHPNGAAIMKEDGSPLIVPWEELEQKGSEMPVLGDIGAAL